MSNTAASAAAISEHATRQATLVLLAQHVPSLSDGDEQEIIERAFRMVQESFSIKEPETDVADLALRTCSCGKKIDGFYEYVDHLTEVFRGN